MTKPGNQCCVVLQRDSSSNGPRATNSSDEATKAPSLANGVVRMGNPEPHVHELSNTGTVRTDSHLSVQEKLLVEIRDILLEFKQDKEEGKVAAKNKTAAAGCTGSGSGLFDTFCPVNYCC